MITPTKSKETRNNIQTCDNLKQIMLTYCNEPKVGIKLLNTYSSFSFINNCL